jgi:hypothetical protein
VISSLVVSIAEIRRGERIVLQLPEGMPVEQKECGEVVTWPSTSQLSIFFVLSHLIQDAKTVKAIGFHNSMVTVAKANWESGYRLLVSS